MARRQQGKHPEVLDSSPAGIAHAFCVKGNADAVHGGESVGVDGTIFNALETACE